MSLTAGYDIGGAHLKVALVDNGVPIVVEQIACPLWRGLDQLDAALDAAHALTKAATVHAVTMTGELADVFPDRYTGVARIAAIAAAKLGPHTLFWMGLRGFGSADDAQHHYDDVASTNFFATAALCARRLRDGVLIDMGSTTTDIIPFADGRPTPRGVTDADRLRTGELVYTGLTRTPVMAVTTHALFQGTWQTLARDPFATMADVRRITCDLPEGVDLHPTQDGRGTSEDESRARLARCFGRDCAAGEEADWAASARFIAELQQRSIHDGALQVLSAQPPRGPMSIVAAGIGERIALEVARRLDLPAVCFGAMIKAPKPLTLAATRYAPAVAVALLAATANKEAP
jgi:(4-(4-[2-(gamma-L-glutamylamino)ethyl]phenoxymethyl)furan-2-yl)methanamine synthase